MTVFYTEGGHKLGLGNIFRSLSLAKALRDRGCDEIRFVTSSEPYACSFITDAGFEAVITRDPLSAILDLKPHRLIIDFLGIGKDFVSSASRGGQTRIIIIGNDSEANHEADLVVNAIIGTGFINRCFRDSYGTLNLWGPRYLVLREEFEELRDTYRLKESIRNVVLLFGGSDQADFSSKVLNSFSGTDYAVTLILGAGYRDDESLEKVLSDYKGKVEVYRNVGNVSDFYKKADFLFTSPGTALFEGLCMGIPAISFFQNQSQIDVFGPFMTTCVYSRTTDPVAMMLDVYSHYGDFRSNLESFAVGMGRNEIIDNILAL